MRQFHSEPGVERTVAPPINPTASCDRCGRPAAVRLHERGGSFAIETYFCAKHFVMAQQQQTGGA